MAGNRGGGGQQPIRGFRPGKEPPHLRKRRARGQLPADANWGQKKLVDAIGDKTPQEVRAMVRRWTTILLTAAVGLGVLGIVLYRWSVVAGIVVHILAVVALVLWFRLWKQRQAFETLAESLGGGARSRR